MTDKNNGGPAFPLATSSGSNTEVNGMTLRDYFAGQELAKIKYALVGASDADLARQAEHCYRMADAMLKAREL